MRRLTKEKAKTYAIIILTIGLIVSGMKFIEATMEDKRDFESFVHDFYNRLKLTSNSTANVLSVTEDKNELVKGITELKQRFETTESLLRIARQYVNDDITVFFPDSPIDLEVNEAGRLTEQQIKGLEKMRESLDHMVEELKSDELNEGNKNVSVEAFNEIINEAVD